MTTPLILVTNDDGYDSPGLMALRSELQKLGDVWVVAPHTEQSAISRAITLWDPLRLHDHGDRVYSVTGTPTDCVYVALHNLLPRRPDLCVSGINKGANLGDDVLYSGTVAGASEATQMGVPSIAVSLTSYRSLDFDVSAKFAGRLSKTIMSKGLPRDILLNLNVPKDANEATEMRVGKLGRRRYEERVVACTDPRERPYYWIGGRQLGHDDMPGSDCNLNAEGFVTVTPVKLDMTDYRFLQEVAEWIEPGNEQ